jgi:ABC-2 type transport system permease protein
MTTPQLSASPASRQQAVAGAGTVPLAVRARDVLASEWTKVRSTRSNIWTLVAAAVVTMGSTAVVAQAIVKSPARGTGFPVSPLTQSFIGYAEYAVLPVTILGVLAFTSEYSSGLIATTYTAVPRRWAVLAGKAVVAGTIALVVGEVLALATFGLTQALLSGRRGGLSLAAPGVPGAVLAAGVVLAACALTGLAFGAMLRHPAGAIAASVAVIYATAAACLLLPSPWQDRVGRFTLPLAATQVVAQHPQASLFAPAWSMLVILAWPAAALLAAAVVITRRAA